MTLIAWEGGDGEWVIREGGGGRSIIREKSRQGGLPLSTDATKLSLASFSFTGFLFPLPTLFYFFFSFT